MWPQHSSKSHHLRSRLQYLAACRHNFCSHIHYSCECKGCLDGIFLIHFWTSTHCVHLDTGDCFLCFGRELSTWGSSVHQIQSVDFVSRRKIFALFYNLCDSQNSRSWTHCLSIGKGIAGNTFKCSYIPFTTKTVALVNFCEYTVPVWQKYVPSSSLLTFLMVK